MRKKIYALSDSVGETAEMVAKATASQFGDEDLDIVRVSFVLSESKIDEIIDDCVNNDNMICHTIVMPRLRAYIEMQAEKANDSDLLGKLDVMRCVECGMCSYICPSKIEVTDFVAKGKRRYGLTLRRKKA